MEKNVSNEIPVKKGIEEKSFTETLYASSDRGRERERAVYDLMNDEFLSFVTNDFIKNIPTKTIFAFGIKNFESFTGGDVVNYIIELAYPKYFIKKKMEEKKNLPEDEQSPNDVDDVITQEVSDEEAKQIAQFLLDNRVFVACSVQPSSLCIDFCCLYRLRKSAFLLREFSRKDLNFFIQDLKYGVKKENSGVKVGVFKTLKENETNVFSKKSFADFCLNQLNISKKKELKEIFNLLLEEKKIRKRFLLSNFYCFDE